jgi:hypothetical protein
LISKGRTAAAWQFGEQLGNNCLITKMGAPVIPIENKRVGERGRNRTFNLLMACQPGGFEKFFDVLSKISATDTAQIKEVMANHGMDYAGPPLFGAWREER